MSTLALSREDVADVVVSTDVPRVAWDNYVQSCPDATVYHLSGWADIMRDVFGHRTEYLSAVDRGRVCFRHVGWWPSPAGRRAGGLNSVRVAMGG